MFDYAFQARTKAHGTGGQLIQGSPAWVVLPVPSFI